MNTLKIDGSTMRTHWSEYLATSRPKTHWCSLISIGDLNISMVSFSLLSIRLLGTESNPRDKIMDKLSQEDIVSEGEC